MIKHVGREERVRRGKVFVFPLEYIEIFFNFFFSDCKHWKKEKYQQER